jgi:hypothetical protein
MKRLKEIILLSVSLVSIITPSLGQSATLDAGFACETEIYLNDIIKYASESNGDAVNLMLEEKCIIVVPGAEAEFVENGSIPENVRYRIFGEDGKSALGWIDIITIKEE